MIFDIADATTFGLSRASLTANGRYLTLYVSVRVLVQMAVTAVTGGRRAKFSVALPDRDEMAQLRTLLEQGAIRPVIAKRFPLERIAEAHAAAEAGSGGGSVVVTVGPSMPLRAVGTPVIASA